VGLREAPFTIVGVPAENRIDHLSNRNLEHYSRTRGRAALGTASGLEGLIAGRALKEDYRRSVYCCNSHPN
jgi:hypothetical protein